ncbi:hypothetical protein ACQKOM_23400 [Peribacillus frigoritolerans]|uniref:hypothetical protein n=1 Tax=Peribacillus frigoritolerans TaxID=450367 RepID=UPI003D037233
MANPLTVTFTFECISTFCFILKEVTMASSFNSLLLQHPGRHMNVTVMFSPWMEIYPFK